MTEPTCSPIARGVRTEPVTRDQATEARYADLAERLIPVACDLVGRVHDEGRESIGQLLDSLSQLERHALPVVLAAMVPLDHSVTGLLAWIPQPDCVVPLRTVPPSAPCAAQASSPPALRPCGTHAAFARHKKKREPVCEACEQAERLYQRKRKRGARKQRRATAAGQRAGVSS